MRAGKFIVIVFIVFWILNSCNRNYNENKTGAENFISDSIVVAKWQQRAKITHDTNVKLSIRIIDSVLYYSDSIKYYQGIVSSLLTLGGFHHNIGNYDITSRHYFKALEIAENKKFKREQAWALNEIGNLFITQKNYEKAFSYYERAKNINEELKNERWIGVNNNNIGLVLLEKNDYETAKQHFQKALKISKQNKNFRSEANSYGNLGLLFEKQRNYDSALFYQMKRLNIYSSYKDNFGICNTHWLIGNVYFLAENYDSAKFYLLHSQMLAKELNYYSIIENNCNVLQKIFEKENNFRMALAFHQLYKAAADTILNIAKSNEIVKLELNYESTKQQKIEELKRQKRFLIYILVMVSLVFICITLLVTFSRQRIKLKNSALIQANLLLEQQQLHDKIEQKNKELAQITITQAQKNEHIKEIAEKLKKEKTNFSENEIQKLDNVLKELNKTLEDDIWEDFEIRFQSVHIHFYENLLAQYPDLTKNEKRLCAFLKLDMSTKEIAAITRQSENALTVARARLRKKLGIDNTEINISNFLAKF